MLRIQYYPIRPRTPATEGERERRDSEERRNGEKRKSHVHCDGLIGDTKRERGEKHNDEEKPVTLRHSDQLDLQNRRRGKRFHLQGRSPSLSLSLFLMSTGNLIKAPLTYLPFRHERIRRRASLGSNKDLFGRRRRRASERAREKQHQKIVFVVDDYRTNASSNWLVAVLLSINHGDLLISD